MRVYDNKLSIWNEGLLPEGLDAVDLKRHHVSRPRNPLIADVCFKAGYIDAWGRGTLKIINSCKNAELPEPDMIEFNGGLLVTVFKNKYSIEQLKRSGLNKRQIMAVQYVIENGKITNKAYQKINNVSKATATRDLSQLYEIHKILIKTGSTGVGTEYSF